MKRDVIAASVLPLLAGSLNANQLISAGGAPLGRREIGQTLLGLRFQVNPYLGEKCRTLRGNQRQAGTFQEADIS
jgi:hypothetical protein